MWSYRFYALFCVTQASLMGLYSSEPPYIYATSEAHFQPHWMKYCISLVFANCRSLSSSLLKEKMQQQQSNGIRTQQMLDRLTGAYISFAMTVTCFALKLTP